MNREAKNMQSETSQEIENAEKALPMLNADLSENKNSKSDIALHTSTQVSTQTSSLSSHSTFNKTLKSVQEFGREWRKKTISALPTGVVNNATNIIALFHIVAEGLMLKASGVKFLNPRLGQNVNYLLDPPRNVYRAILGIDKKAHLQNPWQTRSTTSGIAGWIWGTAVPEKKDSPEEIEQNVMLSSQHPIKYVVKNFADAFKVWDPTHKRKQIGLGVTVAGICSLFSGFNNINQKTGAKFINPAHSIGGVITAISGVALWFSATNQQGWSRFGSILWFRLPLVGFGIHKKMANNDRWQYYAAGQAAFQSAALASFLVGGAHKLDDGTIINTKTDVDAAKLVVREQKRQHKINNRDETEMLTFEPVIKKDEVHIPSAMVSHVQSFNKGVASSIGHQSSHESSTFK